LAIERGEKRLTQCVAIRWEIVEPIFGLSRQPCRRQVQKARQIDAHRPVKDAAQQLGALDLGGPPSADAPQELMERIAIGEGVVRRLAVRMLVGGAESGDP
jgi:hypothetical protein